MATNNDFELTCVEMIEACLIGGSRVAKSYMINRPVVERLFAYGLILDEMMDTELINNIDVRIIDDMAIEITIIMSELSIVIQKNKTIQTAFTFMDNLIFEKDDRNNLIISAEFKSVWIIKK